MARLGKIDAHGEVFEEVISEKPRAGYIELPDDVFIGDKLVAGKKVARSKELKSEVEPEYDPKSDLGKEISRKKAAAGAGNVIKGN